MAAMLINFLSRLLFTFQHCCNKLPFRLARAILYGRNRLPLRLRDWRSRFPGILAGVVYVIAVGVISSVSSISRAISHPRPPQFFVVVIVVITIIVVYMVGVTFTVIALHVFVVFIVFVIVSFSIIPILIVVVNVAIVVLNVVNVVVNVVEAIVMAVIGRAIPLRVFALKFCPTSMKRAIMSPASLQHRNR